MAQHAAPLLCLTQSHPPPAGEGVRSRYRSGAGVFESWLAREDFARFIYTSTSIIRAGNDQEGDWDDVGNDLAAAQP
jgi:hypothetical protein